MATLLIGPRLGAPASTGFNLWAQLDGAATVDLETKLTTDTVWTAQDSQAVETGKRNTVVLEASGLLPQTSYDYRILIDSVEAFVEETMTMPTSGRFVVYQITDTHENVNAPTMLSWALTDWETKYKPLGVPALTTHAGDIYSIDPGMTPDDAAMVLEAQLVKYCGAGLLWSRIPMLYQFDDWDWGGNNSSNVNIEFVGGVTDADALQDAYWRNRPRPAAPSYAYSLEVCGVPMIFADSRSQRTLQTTHSPPDSGIFGDNGVGDPYGDTQIAWLKSQFQAYGRRGLVLFWHTDTFKDQISSIPSLIGTAQRDSVGVYYQKKRNELIDEGMLGFGYDTLNNLLVLSGDDHRNTFLNGTAGEPTRYDYTGTKPSYRLAFKEAKINGTSGNSVGQAPQVFGDGPLFTDNNAKNIVLVLDITAGQGGKRVSMRLTWWRPTVGVILTSSPVDTTHQLPGDFYYNNGDWQYYEAGVSGTQFFPAENSNEPKPLFGKAYVDDILGTVHTRDRVVRDVNNRLRRLDDLDTIDRDEERLRYRTRGERPVDPVR